MHVHEVADAFAAAGAVLDVVLNVPQCWRSCRHRRVHGLSPAARWLVVLQSAAWVTFGIGLGCPAAVVANLVCLVLQLGVLGSVLRLVPAARRGRILLPWSVGTASWLVLLAWAGTTGGLPVGVLAAGSGAVALLPQLSRLRPDAGRDVRGVSAATSVLMVAANTCWAVFGVLIGEAAVWVPSVGALLGACLTLWLLRPATRARRGTALRRPPVLLPLPVATRVLQVAA